MKSRSNIVFVWANFGPYHIDRLDAVADALKETHHVIGIEIAGTSAIYPWARTANVVDVDHFTLFPARLFESVSAWRIFFALGRACLKARARDLFLCHYERIDIYAIAWVLRIFGYRVHVMIDSKFDDKPRLLGRELLKKAFFLPYYSAIVGGERTLDYLRFFGFDPGRIHLGYDTVSIKRIRRLAGSPPAPAGAAFRDRHFTIVARLVPKKNILTALEAYSEYCRIAGHAARELHICGSGELEHQLRATVKKRSLKKVIFHGFVQSSEVAQVLSTTLALVLPSKEEQWGLVVNEAVAMGLPILCSVNVGARDRLVKAGINGYIFEPDNPAGLAWIMYRLAEDELEWRRLAKGSARFAHLADTGQFSTAVTTILGIS
jgi:glycosyltransferase involved in cell wall biosynthesis